MNTRLLASSIALSSLMAVPAFAETWIADPAHTDIRVSYSHIGFSTQSISFTEFSGELVVDLDNIGEATANFTIPVSSVSSGLEMFDNELQGEAFFDGANSPEITFVSTGVEQTGENTVKVTGDLSFRGATKPATFDVVVNQIGENPVGQFFDYYKGTWMGITAVAEIVRSEWGMEAFIPIGSDKLTIEINAELKAQ